MVAGQLQGFLDEVPSYGTETALVSLVGDLQLEIDGGSVTLFILLDLLEAFNNNNHLLGLGLGSTL